MKLQKIDTVISTIDVLHIICEHGMDSLDIFSTGGRSVWQNWFSTGSVFPRYGSSVELELGQRVSARLTAALAKELDRRSKEALLGKGTEL